jgi:hypothetical protein
LGHPWRLLGFSGSLLKRTNRSANIMFTTSVVLQNDCKTNEKQHKITVLAPLGTLLTSFGPLWIALKELLDAFGSLMDALEPFPIGLGPFGSTKLEHSSHLGAPSWSIRAAPRPLLSQLVMPRWTSRVVLGICLGFWPLKRVTRGSCTPRCGSSVFFFFSCV